MKSAVTERRDRDLDASIAEIILGGSSSIRYLQDLATLIGERDELTDSVTIGDRGTRSSQCSVRRVPIMPVDTIRALPTAPHSCCCARPR